MDEVISQDLEKDELLDLDIDTQDEDEDEIEKEIERRTQEKIENLRAQSKEELRVETLNRKFLQIFSNEENTKDLKSLIKALSGNSKEVVEFVLSNAKPVQINQFEEKKIEVPAPKNVTRDAVLAYLKTKWAPVAADQIWKDLGVNKELLKEPLKSLINLGVVTTVGERRGTKYVFIRETQQVAQAVQAAKALEATQAVVVAPDEVHAETALDASPAELPSILKDNLVPIVLDADVDEQDEPSSTTEDSLGSTDLENQDEASNEEDEDLKVDDEPSASDLEF